MKCSSLRQLRISYRAFDAGSTPSRRKLYLASAAVPEPLPDFSVPTADPTAERLSAEPVDVGLLPEPQLPRPAGQRSPDPPPRAAAPCRCPCAPLPEPAFARRASTLSIPRASYASTTGNLRDIATLSPNRSRTAASPSVACTRTTRTDPEPRSSNTVHTERTAEPSEKIIGGSPQ